jgi:hypothetical protein
MVSNESRHDMSTYGRINMPTRRDQEKISSRIYRSGTNSIESFTSRGNKTIFQ